MQGSSQYWLFRDNSNPAWSYSAHLWSRTG